MTSISLTGVFSWFVCVCDSKIPHNNKKTGLYTYIVHFTGVIFMFVCGHWETIVSYNSYYSSSYDFLSTQCEYRCFPRCVIRLVYKRVYFRVSSAC